MVHVAMYVRTIILSAITTLLFTLTTSNAAAGEIALRRIKAAAVPKTMKYRGKLVAAIAWRDRNGENTALFSILRTRSRKREGASAYNFVSRYATAGGKTRRLRQVKDKVERCDLDITMRFEPKALSVTDLDGDRIGEVTFAYWMACRGDVSPDGLKLLVLEGGDKYIIRGRGHWARCDAKVAADDEACRDAKKLGPALKRGPRAFRRHALKVWARISPQRI
jgi:hypothetical protein